MKNILFLLITIFCCFIASVQAEQLSDEQIVKTTYIYKEVDGVKLQADLCKVKDSNSLKPVVVWLHGGALIWGSKNSLPAEQMKFYLEAGYSVISID